MRDGQHARRVRARRPLSSREWITASGGGSHGRVHGMNSPFDRMHVIRAEVALSERAGATDANCVRIVAIDSFDALGYRGCGREEHSGENTPSDPDSLRSELADNRASQLARQQG